MKEVVKVALVTEVFPEDTDGVALKATLKEAKAQGACLAILPELPLNSWCPATKEVNDDDAEGSGGWRQRIMAVTAAEVGMGIIGGAIVKDSGTGQRFSHAFFFRSDGTRMGSYRKIHLPEEEGFWETSHYEAGKKPPPVVECQGGIKVGIQLCSDVMRPSMFQMLAERGAELIAAPRATPPESYDRWKLVLQANAITANSFVISTNRPRPEGGVDIGGPSVAIAPNGEILAESTDPVTVVSLDRSVMEAAQAGYPGYLKRFPELYAQGWGELS